MSGVLHPLMPLDEAQARLLHGVTPLEAEPLALVAADGRYVFDAITARRTQPAADLSAMDGYAMRADDLSGPWQLVGESAAGHPCSAALQPGETVRISTGALMPHGSGAVLLQEDARRLDTTITLLAEDGPSARHIRRKGFDFSAGDGLLAPGTLLNPARIALALMAGESGVMVHRLPKVAIIDSGDELAADPRTILPHQIPASNGVMLSAMAAPHASQVIRVGPVPDQIDALVNAFEAASSCDVIVTSGGASVGDHDLVRPALERWGATIDFWRIALRPGKPLMVARKGAQVILGLPGNPVSSHVTAFLFLLPLLRALAGAAQCMPQAVTLPLAGTLPAVGNRTEFVRARLLNGMIEPIAEQDSSALRALAQADALIRREINAPPAAAGSLASAYLLHNGGIA